MLKYVSGKQEEIILSGKNIRVRIKTAGLYDFEWEPDETEKEIGSTINTFNKTAATYEMKIDFTGSKEERAYHMNRFFEITEQDVLNKTPGRLYLENQYINCYVIAANHEARSEQYRTVQREATIYAPYPFWTTETMQEFHVSAVTAGSTKKYPYRYPYRYSSNAGTGYLVNDNFTDSNFMLRIYGPVSSPKITIGGYSYCIYDSVAQGEYIRANSRDNTIVKVSESGVETNIFHKRQKDTKFFKKIPQGMLEVDWTGTYPFDITLYKERSEPIWE